MEDGETVLLVVGLGNPRVGEAAEGAEGGGTSPDRELSGWLGNNSNVGTGWELGLELVLESVGKTLVHGGTTGEDDVLGEILSDIDISLLDGVVGDVLDTLAAHTVEGWLEEELWTSESNLAWNVDDSLIWHGVGLVVGAGRLSLGAVLLVGLLLVGNEAAGLLDVLDNFELGSGVKVLTSDFLHELLDVLSESASGNIHSLDSVWD